MSIDESRKMSIEVYWDGGEIVFRFYGWPPEDVRALSENAEFMQTLIDECNEEEDGFIVEIERRRTLH